MSNEDKSIPVFGYKWFSETDVLNLNIREIDSSKKHKKKWSGKLDALTRKDCASRVGEIFDLNDRFAPLVT